MSLDPYPDLPDPVTAAEAPVEPPELSDADSRLLEALSQPQPPVVVAVEEQPLVLRAASTDSGRGGALAPVFQEPADREGQADE